MQPPPLPPSPAPRALAPAFVIRVLFSGFVGQFGWVFCAFGMLFVTIFDPAASVREMLAFRGDLRTAEGVVTGYEATNMKLNDSRVFEVGYRFSAPDGSEVLGNSYSTGSGREPGTAVIVEYVDTDATLSRITGMRRSASGGMALIVVIFPVIGALIGLGSLLFRRRHLRLLRSGTLTTGTLRSSEPTNSEVNGRTVMRLTFEFEPPEGGVFQAVAKTHQTYRLEDEERELLLYDPRNPSTAVVLDELPCQPRVDPDGSFEATASRVPAALYLLLPGISLLALLRYITG